jgi:hypothetical protein
MRDDEEAALPDAPDSVSHHGKEDAEPPQAKFPSDAGPSYEESAAATGGQRSANEGNGSSIVLTGSGDAVVELTKNAAGPAVVYIWGNAARRYFAIKTIRAEEILIATMQPYHGVRSLDWDGAESTGFRVRATGPWRIEVLPLSAIPTFRTSLKGDGDMVVHYTGHGSHAEINGNKERHYFRVRALSAHGIDSVVSTIPDSWPISGEPQYFEVEAIGPWTITVK